MNDDFDLSDPPSDNCLSPDDFYHFIAKPGDPERDEVVKFHLAHCAYCAHELAELMKMILPGSGEPEPEELTESELHQALAIVQGASRNAGPESVPLPALSAVQSGSEIEKIPENGPGVRRRIPFSRGASKTGNRPFTSKRWIRWTMAAAASITLVVLSARGLKYIDDRRQSGDFFARGKVSLEQNYSGMSPGELRLGLPFTSAASIRDGSGAPDSLGDAEKMFSMALTVRPGMKDAHLGLGFVLLHQSRFTNAGDQFQAVLDSEPLNVPALNGRGVARYEEALAGSDPLLRSRLLASALDDFERASKLAPSSPEAGYNRIWALFQSGRHAEALGEIDKYLTLDSSSLWAERLRGLRTKIRATRSRTVDEDVDRAAVSRNPAPLQALVAHASYAVPAAIRSAMRRSLELEGASVQPGKAGPQDLVWAARVLERAYSGATGDHSSMTLLQFYQGLSPSRRAFKKKLDLKFEELKRQDPKTDLAAALRTSRSLETQYALLGDYWQIYNLHQLRGNTLYYAADYAAAISEYGRMLEIAKRLGSPALVVKALGALAVVHMEARKFDDALAYASQSRAQAREHGIPGSDAYGSLILGDVMLELGRLTQSSQEYRNALALAYQLLDESVIVQGLEYMGIAAERSGEFEKAGDLYGEALRQQEQFAKGNTQQPGKEVANRRSNLIFRHGALALRMGNLNDAERLLTKAINTVPADMVELQARNRTGLAEVYLRKNRVSEATSVLQPALAVSGSGQYPDVEWQTSFVQGKIFEQRADYSEALSSMQRAIGVLERMRGDIGLLDLRESFLISRYDPYQAIVTLLFESLKDNARAFAYVDRAKSMTLKEYLRVQGEVERTPGVDAALKAEPVIIEYFFTKDKLLIFAAEQDRLSVASVRVTSETLAREVKDYLDSIVRNDDAGFNVQSRQLYEKLIAPVQNHLAEGSKPLAIIPDGPLHLLPFGSLQDADGRFLIEQAAVTFAPSRGILRHCMSLGRSRQNPGSGSIVLIDGSANLAHARDELGYLSSFYGRNAHLLDPRESASFGQAVTHSDILHFAGHADIRDGKPVLILQKTPAEICLDPATIGSWKMPHSRLVYLAGCSTGIGPIAKGETPWGLIPAFLNAGAPAIVASLSPVDDASTASLTSHFYRLLEGGSTKSEALRQAQLFLLEAARSAGSLKPQSWCPYILVGDPL